MKKIIKLQISCLLFISLVGCSMNKQVESVVNCENKILFAEYIRQDKNFNIGFSLKLDENVCGVYTLQIPAIVENGSTYYYSVINSYNNEIREEVFYKVYVYDRSDLKGQTSPDIIAVVGEGNSESKVFQIFVRSQESQFSESSIILEINYEDLNNISVRFIE